MVDNSKRKERRPKKERDAIKAIMKEFGCNYTTALALYNKAVAALAPKSGE